jgi:hypothetical protein
MTTLPTFRASLGNRSNFVPFGPAVLARMVNKIDSEVLKNRAGKSPSD